MKIVVTGGTGFVGRCLCRRLLDLGHMVTACGTRAEAGFNHPNLQYIQANTIQSGLWQDAVAEADAVFNLAGQTIFHRWTKAHKRKMIDSRILTTRNLTSVFSSSIGGTLVSASAVGYYGDGQEALLTESSPHGTDFLARLAHDWEAEAQAAAANGVRVVRARFGIVLGHGGGALHTMLTSFRAYIGGPMGSGLQWLSWIHMDDLVNALVFALGQPDLQGPVNFCAPQPVRNADLAHCLGRILGKPSKVALPAAILKLAMGEMATALLASLRVSPQKLIESGFEFQYPELNDALTQLLG